MSAGQAEAGVAQTIFLATDGRHVVLGRGVVVVEAGFLSGVVQQGLSGWVATLSGSLYGRKAPSVRRGVALGSAGEALWDPAVAALLAAHRPARG